MTWTADQPIISIRDVYKNFDSVEVLNGISMNITKSEVACIIGPSGSGKSTLLRCINALLPVTSGSIKVKDREVNDSKLNK
jgi:polar amino acid transport system ATP-binding protein